MTDLLITPESDLDLPPDDIAPTDSGVEYPCTVCRKEAGPYKGKGRKPTKCPDHKTGSGTGTKRSGNNHVLAQQAAAALAQINSIGVVVLMTTSFDQTASTIADRNEAFEAAAYNALITDPALCRQILRAGTSSAKVSLMVAYAMLAASVYPALREEVRDKRAARLEASEDA